MIQITLDKVRPHLCISGNWLLLGERNLATSIKERYPFKVRIIASGTEIRIYVDKEEVFSDNRFFSLRIFKPDTSSFVEKLEPNVVVIPAFATGRVGFRLDGAEKARVWNCKVTPI